MSYEAWGEPDDCDVPDWYYTQTVETLRADGWLDEEQSAALLKRADAAEQRLRQIEAAIFDNLPYLENLIFTAGHESALLSTHPHPCSGKDFCLMRQAQKGADAIRAAAQKEEK